MLINFEMVIFLEYRFIEQKVTDLQNVINKFVRDFDMLTIETGTNLQKGQRVYFGLYFFLCSLKWDFQDRRTSGVQVEHSMHIVTSQHFQSIYYISKFKYAHIWSIHT